MTNRDRIRRVLNFEPVDRLPCLEWAGYWDQTIERWRGEGLPRELESAFSIRHQFGLDDLQQSWLRAIRDEPEVPVPAHHGAGLVKSEAEYEMLLKWLYPEPVAFNRARIGQWAEGQESGELAVWITLEGYFWFPRSLLGIEHHLFAFYDQPELMHRINEDLLEYNLRCVDQFCEICVPDFMTIAEDLSYNHGPMLSKAQFDEFVGPYYRKLIPEIRDRGITVMVDTDGDVTELVPWMQEVGVQGFLPLERMAGVDVNALREKHPDLRMVGAFDKTVMHLGEDRVRQEFERLLPTMRSGGFIPSVDHQTPPGVSLDDYELYLQLLREYALKGADVV